MAINPHHTVEEIQGTRCSIVEKKLTPDRASFLKRILEANGYVVLTNEDAEGVTLGVTDLVFNPKYAIYSRKLKIADGTIVTPAIWNQKDQKGDFYWNY